MALTLVFLGVLGADRASKALAANSLSFGAPVEVVPGFFQLTLVHNTGMAFGMLDGIQFASKAWVLTGFSALLLALIVWFAVRSGPLTRWTAGGIVLMLAGALGNMWDRVSYGYVVDFFDVFIGDAHWPVFNVADAAICAGVGLLVIESVAEFRRIPTEPGPETARRAAGS